MLLSLIERLLLDQAQGESIRDTFVRARDSGLLDEIPGLVYARSERDAVAEELVDTGIQRLLGDLDELPSPVLGYGAGCSSRRDVLKRWRHEHCPPIA